RLRARISTKSSEVKGSSLWLASSTEMLKRVRP
ncbi:MAG: hypothetical protein ACI9JP_004059, partial [Granulosicoccus sp.]